MWQSSVQSQKPNRLPVPNCEHRRPISLPTSASGAAAGTGSRCGRPVLCVLTLASMPASRVRSAPRRPILVLWAILTVILVATAYVVALAIAAGCGYLSLVMLSELSFIRVMVGLAAAVCALSILWSLIPRRDRFTPPSRAFDPARQPRLFQEIAAIANEFEEPMPESVYLIVEPNAWVAQRGGLLGFGSRRVMAIGLPLFATLSVAEFRAILAHEFAHYYGGDTGFGVFIERARDSLIRSLQCLSSSSGILAALSRLAAVALLRFVVVSLFGLYWRLFLWLIMLTPASGSTAPTNWPARSPARRHSSADSANSPRPLSSGVLSSTPNSRRRFRWVCACLCRRASPAIEPLRRFREARQRRRMNCWPRKSPTPCIRIPLFVNAPRALSRSAPRRPPWMRGRPALSSPTRQRLSSRR